MGKCFKNRILLPVFIILLIGLLPSCNNDSPFMRKYPPIKIITIAENGQEYNIEAVSGQVITIFKPTITHSQAIRIIKQNNGKVVEQIKEIRYYLVDVGAGNESRFINEIKKHPDIQFAYLNAIEHPCAVSPHNYVLDNFNGNHGNKVSYVFKECGVNKNVHKYNVGYNDDKILISDTEVANDLHNVLSFPPNDVPLIINMSFTPGFTDGNISYWTDENITEDIKNSYKYQYKNDILGLVNVLSNYKDKDFVIIKSAGNEGLKSLDAEILYDLERELSIADFKLLNKHFILVGAEDARDTEYSNTITAGINYNFIYTSVDISDLQLNNDNLYGTSFAAPRVACFISSAVSDYKIKATEALNAVKEITFRNYGTPLTREELNIEAKRVAEANKSKQNLNKKKSENNNSTPANKNIETENTPLQTQSQNANDKYGDFEWQTDNIYTLNGIRIIAYNGSGGRVTIPEKINGRPVTVIGEYAFYMKQVTNVSIPNSVKSIDTWAFMGNHLTSVIIPDNVESIGSNAFMSNLLTRVVMGNNLGSIGATAFADNQLTSIKIPSSVLFMGAVAFEANPLTNITIGGRTWLQKDSFGSDFEDAYYQYRLADSLGPGTFTRPNAKSNKWKKTQ